MIDRLVRRVRLMVARGIVNLVNDAGGLQTMQLSLLDGEVRDDVERVQNYGMTSNPPAGAVPVAVAVAGSRDHLMVVAADHPGYRVVGLQSGEVCIYTDEGDRVFMKRGRVVEVVTKTLRINADTLIELNTDRLQINAPLTNSSGQLKTAGDITDNAGSNGRTVAGMRAQYNSHTHGGVQAGQDNSSTPNKGM